jgi:hypothetical protein
MQTVIFINYETGSELSELSFRVILHVTLTNSTKRRTLTRDIRIAGRPHQNIWDAWSQSLILTSQ